MTHIVRRLLTLCCLFVCAQGIGAEPDLQQCMDFETEGAWQSAPDLLGEFAEGDLWSTRTTPFKILAGGVKLCEEHVKSGKFSGKWSDHPRYPTIHSTRVPRDWSRFKALTFWAYSEVSTGEAITLAVASDNDKTAWKDYFLYTFKVDWTGWKQIAIPFSDFDAYEQPVGWQKIDAVYFFTKIFNRQPNPYTALHLDGMRLVPDDVPSTRHQEIPGSATTPKLPHSGQVPEFAPSILNHTYPETRDNRPVRAPIQYEPYFKTERALYGYYPRFQPGFVSLDPRGRAYVQYGSYVIETLDEHGQWTYRSVLDVLEAYAREKLGFNALHVINQGQADETSLRFDADGDAYMMCLISDPTKDRRSRTGLLLHSRDRLKTWDVYRLPCYLVRFEKFVGHNHDCLRRPPVILLSQDWSPTTISLTIPQKQPDGTLVIPEPQKVADEAIGCFPHSGEANQALTHGDKVFLVYGQLKVLPGRTAEDGVPNYAVTYNLRTEQFSTPVFLGFGGINAKDGHNWPALAVDSKGILHVVINGHHNPFVYTHSLRPWSIDEWIKPERVAKGTSYCGLVCDRNDTLYSVSRNSDPGYYFRLSLHRKKAGQPWEQPKHLVIPFKAYYEVWYHKLTIDPATDRLFLSYYSQGASLSLFKDEYLAYLYTWPDREKSFKTQDPKDGQPRIPLGTDRDRAQPRKYEYYAAPASEMTTLVSDDGGDTWRLAVTDDFKPPAAQ